MKPVKLKYSNTLGRDFFLTLRKRVNNYFKENNISKYSNREMKFKTVFMFMLYFIPYFLMLFGIIGNLPMMYLIWIVMGIGIAGVGLSVMHDANHGAYSKNLRVNKILGASVNFVGGYDLNWKIQHNVLHHSYTNVEGYDEDIDSGLFRFSPTQEKKVFHKYQVFYAPFLYSFMTLYWVLFKDFIQLKRYNKNELLETQNVSYKKALTNLIIIKVLYIFFALILPIIVLNFPVWHIIIGFLIMHLTSGFILSMIFQPAHVIEETDFYFLEENQTSIEEGWAVHQIKTTANFANKAKLFSWFIGGLNFQIEHHLFPNLCHVHYKKISKIVKQTTKELGLPYHSHSTFFHAIYSHFKILYKLGRV